MGCPNGVLGVYMYLGVSQDRYRDLIKILSDLCCIGPFDPTFNPSIKFLNCEIVRNNICIVEKVSVNIAPNVVLESSVSCQSSSLFLTDYTRWQKWRDKEYVSVGNGLLFLKNNHFWNIM